MAGLLGRGVMNKVSAKSQEREHEHSSLCHELDAIYIYMYKNPVVLRKKECMLLDSNKGTVSL